MSSDELREGDPLRQAVDALRAPVPIAPGLAVRAAHRQRARRRRRVTRGLVIVMLVGVLGVATRQRASGTPITFSFADAAGRSVSLVGDFTDWRADRVQLERSGSGTWQATVKLPPGRYRFAYLVDHAQWRADSTAAVAPDDFGRPTSVVTVVGN